MFKIQAQLSHDAKWRDSELLNESYTDMAKAERDVYDRGNDDHSYRVVFFQVKSIIRFQKPQAAQWVTKYINGA